MIGSIENVIAALNAADVRYLVVGGVAVVLHGHLRTTGDLDLVIQLERANVLRAVAALEGLGYRPRPPETQPDLEIDLFVAEPFDFNAVHARAVRAPLERVEATVISLEDLIALKSEVKRPRDSEDIEALRAIERKRSPPGGDRRG